MSEDKINGSVIRCHIFLCCIGYWYEYKKGGIHLKKGIRITLLCFVVPFLLFFSTNDAFAHSIVIEETPDPNSQLEMSPDEVRIHFDGKVEKELVSITVTDKNNQLVTSDPTGVSEDQQEIYLELPELATGIYLVEYYIISANDGHPVSGSYYFKVTTAQAEASDGKVYESDENSSSLQADENASDSFPDQLANPAGNNLNVAEWILFGMRAVYYSGLLLTIGWIFWWRYIQKDATELKKKYLFWGIITQMVHLVGLICMILIQLNMFTNNGLFFVADLPFGSSFGLLWIISLGMSIIGFLCLFRNKLIDLFWVLVIVVSKSLNGHSMEFDPSFLLVISNSIHLIAASIWAAGLLFIISFWKKHRLHVHPFLPIFSKHAYYSIMILSITGILATLAYLPSVDQLLSSWGLVLLSKVAVVLFVVCIGALIRFKLKKKNKVTLGIWLKLDFTCMMIIIVLVSILTYLNPLS